MLREQGINSVFTQLSEQGIQVLSMRNKANRLEELFVSLVNEKQGRSHMMHLYWGGAKKHLGERDPSLYAHLGADAGAASHHHDPLLYYLR
ncbi:ABC transporter ATP-binding protein [Escherichia coli]|uniref:ABC transporter ATP-binding protein n=1 Tax=Escherichia coli TaxID=562 RepID=A0A484YMT0_ECOLX|nr:ABC transporter ATP-binding protein [Escherichia coli]